MTLHLTIALTVLMFPLRVRGGRFHNHLVDRAAGDFRTFGFAVELECAQSLPDGRIDYLDLLATRGTLRIAGEVETTVRNLLANVEMARQLDLPLWVIVPNHTVRRAALRCFNRSGRFTGSGGIQILLPGQLVQALTNCLPCFSAANQAGTNRKSN